MALNDTLLTHKETEKRRSLLEHALMIETREFVMPKITFVQADGSQSELEVSSGHQSVMEFALENGIGGIDADCGGSAVCGTCHCFVADPDMFGAVEPNEEAMLGLRPDRKRNSRLSCQLSLSDISADTTITLPEFQM